jgi:superoxide dismutase, Cu-Zn family
MGHIRNSIRITAISSAAAAALAVTALVAGNGAAASGAIHASASIEDASGNTIGFAKFTEDAGGTVHVNVKVSGLAPGLHGTHIHAAGLCEGPGFTTAGGHFNPTGAPHGEHSSTEAVAHHAGDLPNMDVSAGAQGHLSTTSIHFTLTHLVAASLFDADGSAIVVHAATDDYTTQPTGNSGARVACGVIVAA